MNWEAIFWLIAMVVFAAAEAATVTLGNWAAISERCRAAIEIIAKVRK